jgi:hypothetical protein
VNRNLIPFLVAVIVLGCLAFFVWPTRYRYDHLKIGQNEFPVRTDRLSGATEIFYPSGWAKRDPYVSVHDIELDPRDVATLQTTGEMHFGSVKIQVYNGSKYKISEISVSISIFDSKHNPVISNRVYRLTPSYPLLSNLSPQTSGEFSARTGLDFQSSETWEFAVVGAKGQSE